MSKRLGERLVEAGLLSAGALEQGLQHQKITSLRLGDCLIELGLISEAVLLKHLAQDFQTRFVTAEKLSAAKIAPDVLDRIPVRMAEAQNFMPISIDAETRTLTVVMAHAQNRALCQEIALVAEMKTLNAYIGTRAAIQAAIKKFYYGDPTAFQQMFQSPADSAAAHRKPVSETRGASTPAGTGNISHSLVFNSAMLTGSSRGISENDYLETLNVLVTLSESGRKDFRGHSAQVARQSAAIARKIGLQPREVAHTTIAAYLHDLGKKTDRHLTLLAIAKSTELRSDAKRRGRVPVKMFEAVHLPGAVNSILAHQYEAWDGSGVPTGSKGDDIPAGARIIAAVDAFLDLTRNPLNPFGRLLEKSEALVALHDKVGVLFDARVVAALTALQSGDLLRQRMETDGRQVFVAEPEEGTRTELLEAFGRQGLVTQGVFRLDGIVDGVVASEADTVVLSLAYGVNDLVSVVQFLKSKPETAIVPVLVIGDPTDAGTHQQLVDAGVAGFLPAVPQYDAIADKVKQVHLEAFDAGSPGHVVRGSFDELPPVELAKILGDHRKSGRLTIKSNQGDAIIHVERGRAISASCGEAKGDLAIHTALALQHAEFQFDPEAIAVEMPNADYDLTVVASQMGTSP